MYCYSAVNVFHILLFCFFCTNSITVLSIDLVYFHVFCLQLNLRNSTSIYIKSSFHNLQSGCLFLFVNTQLSHASILEGLGRKFQYIIPGFKLYLYHKQLLDLQGYVNIIILFGLDDQCVNVS